MYKPEGYGDVAPYLIVADARAALEFVAGVFAAETLHTHESEDGSIVHAETRIGDSIVMMGQMPGGPEAHIHVYCEDPDGAFSRAVAAGATVVQDVQVKGDGDRRGGVKDGNGTTWWIARKEPA